MNEKPRRRGVVNLAGVCGALLCLNLSSGASAATPPALPPVADSAAIEHHPGKVLWVDLVTPDLDAAERFYGALFGWTFHKPGSGTREYAIVRLGDRAVAGILQKTVPAGEHRQPAWLTFIAVRDIDAARRAVLAHGGKVLSPPRAYPGRGRQAVFADPQGAVFGALESSSGDGADFLAASGDWIWSSLLSSDPAASATFYKAVFGYELFDLPSDDGAQHMVLAAGDYARVGIHTLPPGHHHPHWLDFVRVADASRSAAQAVALGGRILVEPHTDRHGGQVAVVADPAGAAIGLMEWADTYTQDQADQP